MIWGVSHARGVNKGAMHNAGHTCCEVMARVTHLARNGTLRRICCGWDLKKRAIKWMKFAQGSSFLRCMECQSSDVKLETSSLPLKGLFSKGIHPTQKEKKRGGILNQCSTFCTHLHCWPFLPLCGLSKRYLPPPLLKIPTHPVFEPDLTPMRQLCAPSCKIVTCGILRLLFFCSLISTAPHGPLGSMLLHFAALVPGKVEQGAGFKNNPSATRLPRKMAQEQTWERGRGGKKIFKKWRVWG